MYYCPNCKKKFRQYRRRCPICGGPCHRKNNPVILLIVSVCVLFLLLIGLFILLGNTNSVDSGVTTSSSALNSLPESSATPGSSGTPVSSAPPETSTPPASSAPPAGNSMYTREELEAMDKTYNPGGFGAGIAQNHARPSTPIKEQKKYAQYDAHFIGEDTNTVYLTFDCGYEHYATDAHGQEYPVTGKILDVLKEKNVKTVFFITLSYAQKQPELVHRMIDEGHTVGNHSATHPIIPAQTIDVMEYEVMSTHDYILENFGYKMTLFRPPTGTYSEQSLAVLQNLGYKTVLWSFQYRDYETDNQPSYQTALDTISTYAHNGAIYLLHAVSEANANVLGDAIDYLRNDMNYTIELFS